MNYYRRFYVLRLSISLLLLLLISGSVENLIAQSASQKLDVYFNTLQADKSINGNVLIADDNRIIYQKSFGMADFENNKPNDKQTVFQFDSISKTITAVAVLQLKEKGKLNLDDKFIKYFPEFPYPEVSIRQMLTHTSGVPNDNIFEETVTKNPDRVIVNEDIIPEMKRGKFPLLFAPGAKWSYSNLNFTLLAVIVEKLSGEKFEDYLEKSIFAPAKMKTAFVKTTFINSAHRADEAYYYDYPHLYSARRVRITDTFSLSRFKIHYYNLYGMDGAGSIKGTTDDLYRFDQALYNGTLLKSAAVEEMLTPVKLNNGESAVADLGGVLKTSFGLGWFILNDPLKGKVVGHTGGRYGSQTIFLRNLDKKQTVIFFDNGESEGVYTNALSALNILNGLPILIYPKSLTRIYGRALIEKGADYAAARLLELKADAKNFRLSESRMNELGYEFLLNGYAAHALETFKLVTLLFPESWDAYDSYGEALMNTGKIEEAKMMYQKSVALNPGNDAGKKMLERLNR